MKIKDYYKLTKPTTENCLKISGIIFTAFSVIIWGISEVNNSPESIIDPVKVFIICVLTGNTFGLFIACLAFMEGFRQVKSTILLHNSIPPEIKKQYELKMMIKPLNPMYNYLKMQICSSRQEVPLLFFDRLASPDRVVIIIKNRLDDIDFQSLKLKIDRNYRQEQVSLTGWGLAKTVKWRKNRILTASEIENSIEKLIAISLRENLDIEFCLL
ncbi:MAG: hypothetical protein LBK97_05560 [Prevotellaceae bacterium]|jgi:hypothetical protein|nr:hypothetical protein [Prevotellaceae bacterium]